MESNSHVDAVDLLETLVKKMTDCQHKLENVTPPVDESGNELEKYCVGEWDGLICWPNSSPGPVSVICPEYIVDFNHDAVAKRFCTLNGSWHINEETNKTWALYGPCHSNLLTEFKIIDNLENGDSNTKSLIQLYTVGYSCSLVALVFAFTILAYFRRLHCTRNYIHMHLFASFMLRAIIIFVKDRVLFAGSGILDVSTDQSIEELLAHVKDQQSGSYAVGCKLVMTLFHYFLATNYYWILVEALYLHSLIFVAFFSDKKNLWKFICIGWGAPILFVGAWAVVRATHDDDKCWDVTLAQYNWIYNGPIVIATVIDFLLFLNIIRVLWYKMRESGYIKGGDNRKQYRKLAKSTLVLIFMFGVHAIVFIGVPDHVMSGVLWNLRMYFDLFFNSFQGLFVAIIYCFCNGEVQTEIKKAWDRFHLNVEIQRNNRERTRSSVTMLTSFNSYAPQQTRLSIAGQGNRRGSNTLKNSCNSPSVSTSVCGVNGVSEYRAPLLEQNGKRDSPSSNNEDCLLNLGDDEHLVQSASPSSAIVSIQEEDMEEEAFEKALEGRGDEKIDENQSQGDKTSTGTENDGKCKRTPSFDSGISSMNGGNPRLSRGFSTNTYNESSKKESHHEDSI